MQRREVMHCWFWLCLLATACPPAVAAASSTAPLPASNSTTGANSSAANLAGRFLPEKIAGAAIAGSIILRSVHNGLRAAFESMPSSSALVLLVLDGVVCWSVLSVLWELDGSTSSDLGSWTVGSAYAACSILLFTPLMLFVPDQSKSRESARRVAKELQGAVQRAFREYRARMALVYLVTLALQLAAVVSVYQLASLQQGGAARVDGLLRIVSSDASYRDYEELLMPGATVLLYLTVAWSGLSALYEHLFESSFAVDFPVGLLHNAFPSILGEPRGHAPVLSFDDKPVPVPRERLERLKELKKGNMQEWKKAAQRKGEEAKTKKGQVSVQLKSTSLVQLESRTAGIQEDVAQLDSVVLILDVLADAWIKQTEGMTEEIQQTMQRLDESPWLFCAHYAAYMLYSAAAATIVVWLGARLLLLSADLHVGVLVSAAVLLPFFALLCVFACFGVLGVITDEEVLEREVEAEVEALERGEEDLVLPAVETAAHVNQDLETLVKRAVEACEGHAEGLSLEEGKTEASTWRRRAEAGRPGKAGGPV